MRNGLRKRGPLIGWHPGGGADVVVVVEKLTFYRKNSAISYNILHRGEILIRPPAPPSFHILISADNILYKAGESRGDRSEAKKERERARAAGSGQ